MTKWEIISLLIVIALFIIGTFSTVHKDSKKPLRKNSLNDLKETLPRSKKYEDKRETMKTKNR